MRLEECEIKTITDAIKKYDDRAKVFLFGSRKDDLKKGGDLDLIIISEKIKKNDLAFLEGDIFKLIDERKIDILLSPNKIKDSFIKLVIKNAVPLC